MMTSADRHAYPELRQLFGAYLNQDFPDEYGSVREAIRAYRSETSAEHRRGAVAELQRLIAASPGDEVGERLTELGCEVYFERPGDTQALIDEILSGLAG